MPTGRFFREYGGDPGLPSEAWVAWYCDENGDPHMLERCDPASRDELAAKRAARDARRDAQEAAAKARNEERRRELGRR